MYYITVSNGLLQGDHQKKMGSAVWQFMWCLDKITKIDSNGEGRVLGGKPIKLHEISGASERTNSRNLNKLEKLGYIRIIHAPYGLSIRVLKAKKVFQKDKNRVDKSGVPVPERSDINGVPLTKIGVPNKIIQLDKTINMKTINYDTGEEEVKKGKPKKLTKQENNYLISIGALWINLVKDHTDLEFEEIPQKNIIYPIKSIYLKEKFNREQFKKIFETYLKGCKEEDKTNIYFALSEQSIAKYKLVENKKPRTFAEMANSQKL